MKHFGKLIILLTFSGMLLSCASKSNVDPATQGDSELFTSSSASEPETSEIATPVPEIEAPANIETPAFEEAPPPKPVKRVARKMRPPPTEVPTQTEVAPEAPKEEPAVVEEPPNAPAVQTPPVVTATPKSKAENTSLLKGPIGKAMIILAALGLIITVVMFWNRSRKSKL